MRVRSSTIERRESLVQYEYNWWFIVTIIFMLILAYIGALLGALYWETKRKNNRTPLKHKLVAVAIGFLVPLVVFGLLGGVVRSFTVPSTPTSTTLAIAEGFGLQSGKSYPLELGARLGGSVSASSSSGLFSATSQLKGGSALSVSYEYDGASYILEIPTEVITFRRDNSAPPTMVLNIYDEPMDGALFDQHGECITKVVNLFFRCDNSGVTWEVSLEDNTRNNGLPVVLRDNVVNATMVVSEEMYDKILG